MTIKNRLDKLEIKNKPGLLIVYGQDESRAEEEIEEFCLKHNVSRKGVIYMSPDDQKLL